MLAITVQQPWAWAIIHGGKDIENRTRIGTWRRAVGERICVHAGRRWSERGAVEVPRLAGRELEVVPSGAIIGTVLVEEVHPEQGGCCAPWGEQSYIEAGGAKRVDIVHLVLAEPRPLRKPLPIGGALGLWTVGPWREVLDLEGAWV